MLWLFGTWVWKASLWESRAPGSAYPFGSVTELNLIAFSKPLPSFEQFTSGKYPPPQAVRMMGWGSWGRLNLPPQKNSILSLHFKSLLNSIAYNITAYLDLKIKTISYWNYEVAFYEVTPCLSVAPRTFWLGSNWAVFLWTLKVLAPFVVEIKCICRADFNIIP